MDNTPGMIAKRALVYAISAVLVAEPAFAATTDISNVPLASSAGSGVLPNALFILDDSGSMASTYLPDYVDDNDQCLTYIDTTDSNNVKTKCAEGDPSFYTGGPGGFNGVGYDPLNFYQPGLNSNGSPKITPPLNITALAPDAYLGGTNVNLTSGIRDKRYCNNGGVCKRNGSDNASPNVIIAAPGSADGFTMAAGQFPYRTNPINASTATFGLPEMMSMGSFSRSGTTVTVTTNTPHEMTVSSQVWANHSNNDMDAGCATVNGVTTSAPYTFTYTVSGSGNISAAAGTYRKCVGLAANSFVRASGSNTVTVASTAHGLVNNDRITVRRTGVTSLNVTDGTVSNVSANSFQYTTSGDTSAQSVAGWWVRTDLYNRMQTVNGSAMFYKITPVEYCSDAFLTTCTLATTPGTAPAGFPNPAPVRFCKSREDAIAPGLVSGTSGSPATARCQGKYINTTGNVYKFARYGLFTREHIRTAGSEYFARTGRVDCAAAPKCSFDEEIQNYARWYTYYRDRMTMMKTGTGRALLSFIGNPTASPPKPNSLRMGFITINPRITNGSGYPGTNNTNIQTAKYERIRAFDTTQASNIYTKLYAQIPGPATPLPQALSRAGWIFAGKLGSGMTPGLVNADDPVIASCQRNFALLTTDGYWNGALGQNIAGDDIGNQDGVNPTIIPPYTTTEMVSRAGGTYDGSDPSVVTTTTTTSRDVVDEEICYGGNPAFGGTVTCPCSTSQRAVLRRTRNQDQVSTNTGGVIVDGTPSFTGAVAVQNMTGCVQGDVVTTVTRVTETEDNMCTQNNNSNFSHGGSANHGGNQACGCTGTGTRRRIKRRVIAYDRTVIEVDGVVTSSTSSNVLAGWPIITNLTASPCPTTNPPPPGITPASSVDGAETVTPSDPALTVAVATTLAPNPQTSAPTNTSITASGGIQNTLADVALYYFMTDLRGGIDGSTNATGPANSLGGTGTTNVATNNVPAKTGAKDFVTHQHMVTFTIGLADGLMRYDPKYETASAGDFVNIKNGTTGACFWSGTGACNWPVPAADSPTALDDLWHAAVNGRGQYYQALNATALAVGLAGALSALNAQVAAAAASATSSPNVTQTENQIFSTTYETNTWSGKVFAQTIDQETGNVNSAIQWQADEKLLELVPPVAASNLRNLYTFATTGDLVKAFTWGNLDADEQLFFANKCTPLTNMTQCATLTAGQVTTANLGTNMVDFLRGGSSLELSDPVNGVYRDRTFIDPTTNAVTQTIMGDTISAKPAYVRRPTFNYGGTYNDFRTAQSGREPRVFVGANDGYLHAFNGDTGVEAYAYLPRFLMPGLYSLADTGYASAHRFYVDGTPETADIQDSSVTPPWKTILVGGAGGGARGFYALDVTSASAPKGLWEFCNDATLCAINDANLGLSYGNPVIGKRSSDGRWVVVLTSGLNNTGGDGRGWFYVLDALTGTILHKVSTGVGDPATPSGLMKISPFFENALQDATFRYIYGGDQLGNVWRLDMGAPIVAPATIPADPTDASLAPTLMHMAQLKDGSGKLQPITTRPALTRIADAGPAPDGRVIYVATGRYLGDKDLTDPTTQSPVDNTTSWLQTLYAFKDKNASYGTNLRSDADLVLQEFTYISATERGLTSEDVDWSVNDGWMVDFVAGPLSGDPDALTTPGERVNIDPRLILGTLVVATNIPAEGGSCSVGGSSRLYQFNYKSGWPISGEDGVVGVSGGGTIAVGMAIVQLPSGAIKDIVTGADTSKTTSEVQISATGAGLRRFSYRER